MTPSEIISISAIIVAFFTFVGTNVWNLKNHRNDIKKDTILSISGALNRQTQLIVKMADPNTDQSEINRILSDNEYIFGQMFTALNSKASSQVLNYLAELADTIYELNLMKHSSNNDPIRTFSYAIKKHATHMNQLPKVIAELKVELGIEKDVEELERAINNGCERINSKVASKLDSLA